MKAVGVMPLYDDEKESYWMLPGYMRMLEEQGAVPLMLPMTADREKLDYFLSICDGFLLTGGHDVSPQVYRAVKSEKCGACCPLRDEMEFYLLREAADRDKAVLGICRGIQLMNVCYGGTLYQDLPSEYGSGVEHHMKPPYDRVAHMVDVRKNTPLYDAVGKERIGVNSYHHQAINELSPAFEAMAVSEDGLIEAIFMPGKKYVAGVQWHPEFFYETDESCVRLIESFVRAM